MNLTKAVAALLDAARILGLKTSPGEAADAMARELQNDLREIYDAWLVDLSGQLEDEPDSGARDALIIAALAVLLGQVKARSRARLYSLAMTLDATDPMIRAMEGELAKTLDIFEDKTLPAIRQQLMDSSHGLEFDPAAFVGDNAGLWARIGLIGGIMWTAYVAGRVAQYSNDPLARWIGPNDSETCEPCDGQLAAGIRPLSQTPLPGPAVCLGLTNCRHDIEVQDPATGRWSLA